VSPSSAAGFPASNADSSRGELFRAYARGRAAMYSYVLGGGGVFLVGAWQQSPLIMAAGPAAVALLVLVAAFVQADRSAADRFYAAFASELGLSVWPRFELLPLTPLLGAGDKRWCEHWMTGTLPGEPAFNGGIGQLVFQEIDRENGRTRVIDTSRFTLCTVELEPSLPYFKGLYVRRRRGIFPEGKDWVRKSGTYTFELESSDFTSRYEVRIADDQSEVMARQLLAPSLVAWLASHPLAPCFEVKAGTLAVYLHDPVEDEGNLTFLLDAARHLASCVLRETDEALTRARA
jgi:hypothetical protein